MTAPPRQALIQALITEGFLLVKDLPKQVKVVRQAKVMELRP